jgi:hypothetical protein
VEEPVALSSRRPPVRVGLLLVFALAILGLLLGIAVTISHLRTDPLADVRAYYDAGARLNAGQPLYPADADTTAADFYRYPPLLAIVFRPLALLPYDVVAPLWGLAMIAAFAATLWRIGLRRTTWSTVAILALPIGWTLAIGQAQSLVTLLAVLASPWAIALAANLKLFPAFVGLYWLGRREWRKVAELIAVGVALLLVQLVLEPTGTIHYLTFPSLDQVGPVNNFSPYAISPLLWAGLVVAGLIVVLGLARTRWGWAAAVAYSVLVTPRLLTYQLMTLLAGLRSPDEVDPRPGGGTVAGDSSDPATPVPSPTIPGVPAR